MNTPVYCSVPFCDKRANLALTVKRGRGLPPAVYCACGDHHQLVRDQVDELRAIGSTNWGQLPQMSKPWWKVW